MDSTSLQDTPNYLAKPNAACFRVRSLLARDVPAVCSWVNTREALALVSGDVADSLSPRILTSWTRGAIATFVVAEGSKDRAVGFCTLSRLELRTLPTAYIEICHLIVDPRFRYFFVGSRLCRAAKHCAFKLGYEHLCGRIVSANRYALALSRAQRFEEVMPSAPWVAPGFCWVRFPLSKLVGTQEFTAETRSEIPHGRSRIRNAIASRC